MKYSPNPAVNETIEALLALGCPPIPVAPKQDPRREWCHKVVKTKDGVKYCPIDKNFDPIPRFTGKNPSYLKRDGSPWICLHGEFQSRLPTEEELKEFFCHPDTGVGTLGGHAGVDWLDFDAKNYESQEACDSDILGIIARKNLHNTWIERTGSGGWRIAVKPRLTPTFTNFCTSPDGKHVGEALFEGRFTVLAPSIHPNGNAYRRIGWGSPLEVESLEACGIFPSKDEIEQAKRKQLREKRKASANGQTIPTNPKPQDNPWDIRNFAQYFEGYHERSDGWAAAKCPHHNGTSQTSFRLRLDTGEYKLWCGCNTKDVYKSGLALALAQGYRIPKNAQTISRDQWEIKHGFGRWFFETISGILEKTKGIEDKKPENQNSCPTNEPVEIIRYPQDPLPQREDFAQRTLPKIIFPKGKRCEVFSKLIKLGWRYIVDGSFTGSGKSYEAGMLHPDENASNKIWYFDSNHTNPSTPTIEAMSNLPPRHDGLVMVPGELTPLGSPVLKWDNGEFGSDVARTPSLCHNAPLFVKLKEKGWDVDSHHDLIKSEDGDAVSRNPICKQCRFSYRCHKEIGEGYGYLAVRREVLGDRRIRASIDSAPNPTGEKSYDYSSDIAFVEEASRYLRGTRSLSAGVGEIARLRQDIERKAPDAYSKIQPILFALQDALNGDFDRIDKGKNRGADHDTLISEFPKPTDFANLPALIQQVEKAMPSIASLVEKADSVVGFGGKLRAKGQRIRDLMKSEAAYATKQNIEDLPPNVLVDFLKIWAGLKPGSLRVQGKKLTVTVQDTRHAEILRACKSVIFLDATANLPYLEKIIGDSVASKERSADRILQIEEERPPLVNLTVVNVNLKGMGSNQVSETCNARENSVDAAIRQQHQGQKIKKLAYKKDGADGHWFHHNRGSNAYKGVDVLIASNLPRPNWGACADQFRALFGSLVGFEKYYQSLIEAEIIQAAGRQRAHLYPDRKFTFYQICTNQNLSYLKTLGCEVLNVEAYEISPLAGDPQQITWAKLMQAFGQLKEQGGKITQEAIAGLIGKSQEYISKIAKALGGWAALKKLLLALLEANTSSNNFSNLNDEAQALASSFLPKLVQQSPDEAPQSFADFVTVYGLQTLVTGVKALAPQMQARLLGTLLQPTQPPEPPEKLLLPVYEPYRVSNNFESAQLTAVPPSTEAKRGNSLQVPNNDAVITPTEDKRENSVEVPANEDVVTTPLEILVESLEGCQTPEDFRLAILGLDPQFVEDAIVCQDSQPKRSLLRRWYEEIGTLFQAEKPLDWNQNFEPTGESETLEDISSSAETDKKNETGIDPSGESDGGSQKINPLRMWVGDLLVIIPTTPTSGIIPEWGSFQL